MLIFHGHSKFSQLERKEDPDSVIRAKAQPALSDSGTTNALSQTYFKIHVTNTTMLPSRARSMPQEDVDSTTDRSLSLEFEQTSCPKKDVMKVSCADLQCGMRPRAVSHRAR